MDRIVIVVLGIAFACALLVGSSYAAPRLAPYLNQMSIWSVVMVIVAGMVAGAATAWRRHRNGGLRTSRF